MIGFIFVVLESSMKKMFLCAAFIVGVNAIGFSQSAELWFSAGGAFGNYFMNGDKLESSCTFSPGINLSFYALFNRENKISIGPFFNYGILFPVVNNAGKLDDPSVQLDFVLVGVGFGYDINESLKFYFGIGPHLNALFLHNRGEDNSKRGDYTVGFGIGGDIGIKYDFSRFVCLNAGTTITYNFLGYNETGPVTDRGIDPEDSSGLIHRYSMIGIKPYIAIGFSFDIKSFRGQ